MCEQSDILGAYFLLVCRGLGMQSEGEFVEDVPTMSSSHLRADTTHQCVRIQSPASTDEMIL